jgi:hypothetical protein
VVTVSIAGDSPTDGHLLRAASHRELHVLHRGLRHLDAEVLDHRGLEARALDLETVAADRSAGTRYSPWRSLTLERSSPVAWFFTAIEAPATTAPWSSVTRPRKLAVDCA